MNGFWGIVATSVFITIISMLRRKNFSVLIKGKNITITVTTEDIIDSKGNIVIAGSDTFDTELGEIISLIV